MAREFLDKASRLLTPQFTGVAHRGFEVIRMNGRKRTMLLRLAPLALSIHVSSALIGGAFIVAAAAAVLAGAQQMRQLDLRGDRFAPLTWEQLNAEQRTLVNDLLSGTRTSLGGPFNVLLRSPEMGNLAQKLGEQIRFRSSLPPRLNEMAILLTAQWWASQYEWHAHKPLALQAGLSAAAVDDIQAGRRPAGMRDDEAAVYDFSHELRERRRVSDATFQRAVGLLGERGVVDLIGVMGYYDLVSMALNVDRYPLPAGAPLPFREPSGTLSTLDRVDHLVYATPDLAAGIARIEQLLGVRATPGGQHPGRGTRNALIALGPNTYIEIIGPDPEQPAPKEPRPFGIDGLKAPRLVTWSAKERDLAGLSARATEQNVRLGALASGSRRRPDGVLLAWNYTDPRTVVADGVVPFFIDWGTTPHPAASAVQGGTLAELTAEHPDPARVTTALTAVGLNLAVKKGSAPALVAIINTPRGRVELR
jgi:4-carboxymuconolactone decarboxylase